MNEINAKCADCDHSVEVSQITYHDKASVVVVHPCETCKDYAFERGLDAMAD